MDAEPMDAEPMDAEPMDAEPMDAELPGHYIFLIFGAADIPRRGDALP
jgi:hypothetical protein